MLSGTTTYPMTLEQESIWLDDRMREGPSCYIESWVCRFQGTLDREAVRWALERIVARHEALRSRFLLADDRLVQLVSPHGQRLELEVVRAAATDADETVRQLVRRPLDPAASPMRTTLVEVAPETAILVVQLHHLVIDDWALETFEQEFAEHYRAHVGRRPAAVSALPPQPGAYATVQRSTPRDPEVRAYWRSVLRNLPADIANTLESEGATASGVRPGRGAVLAFTVDAAATRRVREVCRRTRATPFAVLASAVAVLLASARGTRDVVVGTPVSRRDGDRDQLVAPLSELLPLRLALPPDGSFADLVGRTRSRIHEALAHKDISYAELVGMVRRPGGHGRDLCRTVIVMDDAQPFRLELPGVAARRLYVHSGAAKFDLCFTFITEGGGYLGFLEYALDRIDADAAARAVADFATLLERACADPDAALTRLATRDVAR